MGGSSLLFPNRQAYARTQHADRHPGRDRDDQGRRSAGRLLLCRGADPGTGRGALLTKQLDKQKKQEDFDELRFNYLYNYEAIKKNSYPTNNNPVNINHNIKPNKFFEKYLDNDLNDLFNYLSDIHDKILNENILNVPENILKK